MRTRRSILLMVLLAATARAGEPLPGERWMQYVDPAEAGFDAARLDAVHETWTKLPSSAFMVVADGAVVAGWGDLDRRFMCHSVRKSFLSALYGVYWDRGVIDLNKTLADLGIDDYPDPLYDSERQARILDLLKARSGVFHPAAYAGRTDGDIRGSQGPGRFFAYNNWDFNTLVTIFEQETGVGVFEAFDEHFGVPLGMEDWRIGDGYYHYERDLSRHPAYPFRLSARDAARFGLLFAREGLWGDDRILSHHWVRRSSALYSIDNDAVGYGFMWWVQREPRFEQHGMYAALGVGNQMIAVLPEIDVVIVNRANTYDGERTPMAPLLDLVEAVLAARVSEPDPDPRLEPLDVGSPEPGVTSVPMRDLDAYRGVWDYPAPALGLPARTVVDIQPAEGHVIATSPVNGTFALYVQSDGSFFEEDSHARYYAVHDDDGRFSGLADAGSVVDAAVAATADGRTDDARRRLSMIEGEDGPRVEVGRALVDLLGGDTMAARRTLDRLAEGPEARRVEGGVNRAGYGLLQDGRADLAVLVFDLNARLFPDSFNTWDSLGEAHMVLGHDDDAIRCYQRSLELNPRNENAAERIARIRNPSAPEDGSDGGR